MELNKFREVPVNLVRRVGGAAINKLRDIEERVVTVFDDVIEDYYDGK